MKRLLSLATAALLVLVAPAALACTAFLICGNGEVLYGNNEDYWDTNTRMWFTPGENGDLGYVAVGYDNLFPQGGMNEAGLAFDGFSLFASMPSGDLFTLNPDTGDVISQVSVAGGGLFGLGAVAVGNVGGPDMATGDDVVINGSFETGTFANWSSNHKITLSSELDGSKAFEGTYYLLAFYDWALPSTEVARQLQNRKRGVLYKMETENKRSITILSDSIYGLDQVKMQYFDLRGRAVPIN